MTVKRAILNLVQKCCNMIYVDCFVLSMIPANILAILLEHFSADRQTDREK